MDSKTSGKRCEYTYQNYINKENKLQILKDTSKTMENITNKNKHKIYALKTNIQTFNNEICMKKKMLCYYEKECEDLIINIEEICWRQTKAKTVLKSEKEFLTKYEHSETRNKESEIDFHITEFNINTSNLKKKKEELERNVAENNELINKLIDEVKFIKRECDILLESIGKSQAGYETTLE